MSRDPPRLRRPSPCSVLCNTFETYFLDFSFYLDYQICSGCSLITRCEEEVSWWKLHHREEFEGFKQFIESRGVESSNMRQCCRDKLASFEFEYATTTFVQAASTLIRVQVWVWVSLHRPVASVALYCKQRYVTWTLHYVLHNNDVITDVKFPGVRFLLFSWQT